MLHLRACDGAHGLFRGRCPFGALLSWMRIPNGAAVHVEGRYHFTLQGVGRLHRYHPDGSAARSCFAGEPAEVKKLPA